MAITTYPTIWHPEAPDIPLPNDPTDLPVSVQKAQANPGASPDETNPAKIDAHNEAAKAELAAKNRKRKKGPRMELPFDPTMEEGSIWNLSGFARNFDGKWLVREVVFSLTGKGGSRMEIDLAMPSSPTITTPPGVHTVATRRKLVSNTYVGGEPNPVPLNLGFGGQKTTYLPQQLNVAQASAK